KALVYVIQDIGSINCIGGCITTKIALDGAWVGANHHNSYFSFAVDPGERHLCANWQSHFARLSQWSVWPTSLPRPARFISFGPGRLATEARPFSISNRSTATK